MRREIKFRVWNATKGALWYGGFWVHITAGDVREYPKGLIECDDDDEFILMQYSGLKDVDGKGIFEGDILLFSGGDIPKEVTVGFADGCFVLMDPWGHGNDPELKYYIDMPFCTLKVLRTIYDEVDKGAL